jgi:hypothetical protein
MGEMSTAPLPHDELIKAMSYERRTGILRWKERKDRDRSWNTRFAGKEAGSILSNGYRYINFGGRLCLAHMVAHFYVTGEWPREDIDHRNLNRADNKWRNIRVAGASGNGCNTKLRSTNKSGIKGVSWDKRKGNWVAMITKDRKQTYLGNFATLDAAAEARRVAEAEHHGDFAYQGVN